MIKSFAVVVLALSFVVGFASLAGAAPHASPVAPSAASVDFAPVTFEGMGSVNLAPRPAHFRAHTPKAPPVDLVTRALHAPMHCGPMHENAIGGYNSVCSLDL